MSRIPTKRLNEVSGLSCRNTVPMLHLLLFPFSGSHRPGNQECLFQLWQSATTRSGTLAVVPIPDSPSKKCSTDSELFEIFSEILNR